MVGQFQSLFNTAHCETTISHYEIYQIEMFDSHNFSEHLRKIVSQIFFRFFSQAVLVCLVRLAAYDAMYFSQLSWKGF